MMISFEFVYVLISPVGLAAFQLIYIREIIADVQARSLPHRCFILEGREGHLWYSNQQIDIHERTSNRKHSTWIVA